MSTNNGADNRSTSSLSRNALYTPLVAYEQQNVNPSAYMLGRKNVPSSIRESSLTDFLKSVGQLSVRDVEERIRQRSLTLVGGGINSSLTKTTRSATQKNPQGGVVSNRQRKRILRGTRQDCGNDKEEAFNLLLRLNTQWNDYVRKLVTIEELSDTVALSRKLASRLEVTGAFVRITECCAHKQWVGREGMIVGTTVNTWRIAWTPRHNKAPLYPKLLVVPKHRSRVAFSIHPDEDDDDDTTVTVVIHG